MKQYYESEILFKLMERDGFNVPSSVPPYESEIKAFLINQVKQAYPKLTDYEAEWLLYNYTKHLPADFPISEVTNVTYAHFENVVPFAYQSAILKGNTLVNLSGTYTNKFPQGNIDGNIPIVSTGDNNNKRSYVVNVLPNKEYTIIKFGESNRFNVISYNNLQDSTSAIQLHISNNDELPKKIKITTESNSELIYIYFQTSEHIDVLPKFVIIEGDYTNVDIPYFEGMQSVKMPVLTTSNEDGTKTNILTTPTDLELRGIGEGSSRVEDELDCLTGEVTERVGEIVLDGSENWDEFQIYSDFVRARIVGGIGGTRNSNGNGLLTNSSLTPSDNFSDSSNYEKIGTHSNGNFYILLSKNKLSDISMAGFKNWLSQNPITVHYKLATESVKIVDLMVVDENNEQTYFIPIEGTMNVSSSSETIPPLFDMRVPVEATTQNLASFIELEMEE